MQKKYLWFVGALISLMLLAATPHAADPELARGFAHPPNEAKPQTYWAWMNGNISREGITKDLEEMRKAGLGGALMMEVDCGMPAGSVRIGTPEWRALIGHAIREADRLGLKLTFINGPGWAGSCGPWIKPKDAMQRVIWSETRVHGPLNFQGRLAQPFTRAGFYRDIATFAIPAPQGDMADMRAAAPKLTAQPGGSNLDAAIDGNLDTFATLPPPQPDKPSALTLAFAAPFTARSLSLASRYWQSYDGELQVSDDGRQFRKVRTFSVPSTIEQISWTLEFPAVTGRWFRVAFTKIGGQSPQIELAELELHGGLRLEGWEGQAFQNASVGWTPPAAFTPQSAVAPRDVRDLTADLKPGGALRWAAPAGDWIIVRMGYTPNGTTGREAPKGAQGLECDKLSRQGVEASWNGMMKQIVAQAGPLAGGALRATHIDSWEVGTQNWTPLFREEFRKRRGYDIFPYLPALTGRVVGAPDLTQRFYWDMRRTCADLLANYYYSGMRALAARHGMLLSVEAYGDGPMDFLECAGRSDVPMTEFWANAEPEVGYFSKFAASPGHTYGKKIIQAESFTSGPGPKDGRWRDHPYTLKAVGDTIAFCGGVNRLVVHRFAHQPWPNVRPGMTMGPYGIHFEGTETWWPEAPAWTTYLSRCSYLLQQGLFVADACYYRGESVPGGLAGRPSLSPVLPEGYDFDGCPADVVLGMTVKDGRVVLPDGMSYRYLVLLDNWAMTPKLAAKIRDLVAAGATVIGQKPARPPGLSGYPDCDAALKKIADEVWGKCDGVSIRGVSYKAGRVFWNQTFEEILAQDALAPDLAYKAPQGMKLNYIHRRIGQSDLYFIANPQYKALEAEVSFRVSGVQPELWHPDTGAIEPAPLWHEETGRIHFSLHFDRAGSVFVVFRPGKTRPHLVTLEAAQPVGISASTVENWPAQPLVQGAACALTVWQPGVWHSITSYGPLEKIREIEKIEVKSLPAPTTLTGPWTVRFARDTGSPLQATFERLVSWPERPEPEIRYFSGHATYTQDFDLPAGALDAGRVVAIDLGRVEVIARLKVNGQNFGELWKPPFRAEITRALRPGKNHLEVSVVNLWPNRLIGDEQLPDDCEWNGPVIKSWPEWLLKGTPRPGPRTTFTTFKHWNKGDKLLDSGLLGPVELRIGQRVRVP